MSKSVTARYLVQLKYKKEKKKRLVGHQPKQEANISAGGCQQRANYRLNIYVSGNKSCQAA